MVKTRISFTNLTGLKMSKSTSKDQQYLDNMSELYRNSILTGIGNQPPINPFVVYLGYMYFLKDETLVCVKLQEQNGVFVLWFDNQIIEFDRATGNCFIVSFSRNCLEYFSVGDHYQNATQNGLLCFLFKLLSQEIINRIGRRTIRSIRFFFTPNCVVGHLERAGGSNLKVPNDCLSIHEMILGIKQFMMARFNSSFMRMPNFFLPAIQNVQRTQCQLSDSGRYGVGLFLQTQFRRRFPSFSMISLLMMKLIPKNLMCGGVFQKCVAMKFLRTMFSSICPMICMNFTQNPIGFREAISLMVELFDDYRLKTRLISNGFPRSISDCVKNMMTELQVRDKACEKRRREEFEEYRRLEEEKRQREASIQEFRNGIKKVKTEFQEARTIGRELDEICDDSSSKKMKIDE